MQATLSTHFADNVASTSPSIYANFHSIKAADWCGISGSQATITETMLAFSPGELSTIAGPIFDPTGTGDKYFYPTKVFNFADLPCPPQSVMVRLARNDPRAWSFTNIVMHQEEHWYKPAPGEPYRPFIALPDKIKSIDPAYSDVSDAFFTAFDPPKTLVPSAAMVIGTTTASSSVMVSTALTARPILNAGATRTSSMQTQTTTPTKSQSLQQLGTTISHNSGLEYTIVYNVQPGAHHESSKARIFSDKPNHPTNAIIDPEHESTSGAAHNAQEKETTTSYLQSDHNTFNQVTQSGTIIVEDSLHVPSSQAQGFQSSHNQFETHSDHRVAVTETSDLIQVYPSNIQSSMVDADHGWSSAIVPGGNTFDKSQYPEKISTVDLPASGGNLVTTMDGLVVKPLSKGVLVQSNTVLAGSAPMTVSGTAISLDASSNIYLGGRPYKISTPSPSTPMTLANGAVAVPVASGVSVDGVTLTPGGPAITNLGAKISLGSSSDLIFKDVATDGKIPFTSLAPGASISGLDAFISSAISQPLATTSGMAGSAESILYVYPHLFSLHSATITLKHNMGFARLGCSFSPWHIIHTIYSI